MTKHHIIFHVGYPKAASTALQDTCISQQQYLKEKRVLYPTCLLGKNASKHEELFRLVRLNKVKQALKLLKEEIDKSENIQTVFLSTESIINQLDNIAVPRWVELFQGLKQLGSLEFLIIHRETKSFLKSYYKQAVVNQASSLIDFYSTSLTLAEFSKLPAIRHLVDLKTIIKKIEHMSGSPVKVFDYGPSVVSDVMSWLLKDDFKAATPTFSNTSLKAEAVEFIRQLNITQPTPEKRNAWLLVLSHCSPLGSCTASALASRAHYSDINTLDASWILTIQPKKNLTLKVDDDKLRSLTQKIYQWLCKHQGISAINPPFKNEDQLFMSLKSAGSVELENCIHKKLKLAISASSNNALGEKLFLKKQLELAPFKAVAFSGWGDWEQDPLNNRSWQWRLNWLSFISYLLAYHKTSNNDDVLSFAHDAIQSWLDAYLQTDTNYPFEFIWHDHATALRAEQLVFFAYYCREHATEWCAQHADFLQSLEQALMVHGEWLAKDSFYSEHTNHGLEQARVLLLLGTVFEGAQADEWQRIATQRISSELLFSFTSEGVHVENSPAYHIFVFKVFLNIIKDYPDEVLGDLAAQFSQFSTKALSFITHILRPDGVLPPIGDTEQLPTSDAYRQAFGHTLEYQYFLYAHTQGKQGIPSPALNRVYSQSGYAVFRDQWPNSEHYRQALHLIAKVGTSSRYHHQQDEGHISLYAGGEDWLIDSGLYNYINQDPIRKYMRGRPGHNVPLISHASYNSDFEHRLTAWQVTEFNEAAEKPFLNMKLDVLTQIAHERQVAFDARSKAVTVNDKISANDDQLRSITLQWHFPKDKTITIEGNQVIVTSATGNKLYINVEGDAPDNISVVKGQKDARVFSCISYKANQVDPSQLLRVLFKERADLQVTTQFKFEMAEDKVVPFAESSTRVAHSFQPLLASHQALHKIHHSVMLGSDPSSLQLAKAHQAQALGHISLLVNDMQQCQTTSSSLDEHYLSSWLTCRPLTLMNTTPITVDKSVFQGLEGIDLLVISGAGFSDKNLTTALVVTLPILLKRMTKTGQVWINNQLPEPLKILCETWANRHGFSAIFVVDLEKMETLA